MRMQPNGCNTFKQYANRLHEITKSDVRQYASGNMCCENIHRNETINNLSWMIATCVGDRAAGAKQQMVMKRR